MARRSTGRKQNEVERWNNMIKGSQRGIQTVVDRWTENDVGDEGSSVTGDQFERRLD